MRPSAASACVELLESRRLLSAGDLDRTFGGRGIAYFDDLAQASSVAVQADGRILVFGSGLVGSDPVPRLIRLNSDGARDQSFPTIEPGFDGRVFLLPGDKILLAGSAADGLAAARYHGDGRADTSFNGTGVSLLHDDRYGAEAAVQPDGKIVFGYPHAIGRTAGVTTYNYAAKRMNADGTVDTTFGGDGEASDEAEYGVPGPGVVSDLFVAADGSIVLVGQSDLKGGGSEPYYMSFKPDGSLGGGVTLPDIPMPYYGGTSSEYEGAVLRPDGQPAVIGNGHWPETGYFATGGQLQRVDYDRTQGASAYADAMANAGGNKVVVGGHEGRGFGLQRFNADGTPANTVPSARAVTPR